MYDEWHAERLDLDAYLRRIGDTGGLAATEETLYRLHREHVATIPFENLDIPLGRGISTELDAVQAKLVGVRRGGYCYEHGVLFAAVLERLGYPVSRLLARIGADETRPRTHLALQVSTGDREWLADVGFGAGLLEPLPWGDTGPHAQGSWTYRLTPDGAAGWQVSQRRDDEWAVLYSFLAEPVHATDIELANHYTATHPSSPFVGQPVVMRKDADAQVRLRGRQLTEIRPDGSTTEREIADTELADALAADFGLHLSEREVNELLHSLPAPASAKLPDPPPPTA